MRRHIGLQIVVWLMVLLNSVSAQPAPQKDAAEILHDIYKLNCLGSALYIAAHPDDENTRLITYLANEKLWQTSYLSLTRGDGGQNLIGSEQGNALGVIRTQELLQARRIDGGIQYFGSARDFGFSKTPAETFTKWDKNKVLAEIVWMIRVLKPDLIITRFSPVAGKTHGHHTASAMLAVEAFEAAGDPAKFPEQLIQTTPWKAKRIVWNSSRFFYGSDKELEEKKPIRLEVGLYNKLLGKSYGEIAARSRSMHKSQGFGSAPNRVGMEEYFEFLKGMPTTNSIFDEISTTWARVDGGLAVESLTKKVLENYNPARPEESVTLLLETYKAIQQIKDEHWKTIKTKEVKELIKQCLGLHLEASTTAARYTQGDRLTMSLEAVNRSDKNIVLERVTILPGIKDTLVNSPMLRKGINFTSQLNFLEGLRISQPYWLQEEGSEGMFKSANSNDIGLAENPATLLTSFVVSIEGSQITYTLPVFNKMTDPVKGEVYRKVVVVPKISVSISNNLLLFADPNPQSVTVALINNSGNTNGKLVPDLPKGWKARPASYEYQLKGAGQKQDFRFDIFPETTAHDDYITFKAMVKNEAFTRTEVALEYSHFLSEVYYPEAILKVRKLDLMKKGNNLGYIMGPGDLVPACLQQVGYKMSILEPTDLNLPNLKTFDAIIIGVRAYNTNKYLKLYQSILHQYVSDGGTMIVQYQNMNGLVVDSLGPYPIKLSSERVTVEDGPVTFTNPAHPLLNQPNKITQKDFEGWVQERGLYYPNEWDTKYQTVLTTQDPDELAKAGGVLVANHGKGYFVYSSLAWFRQLPAGVPGAYRLFVNMISIGK